MTESTHALPTRRSFGLLGTSALLAALWPAAAQAAPPINTLAGGLLGGLLGRSDVAIRGYDPVAYFTEGKPVPGRDDFVLEWMGARWKFASQAHLDAFRAEPQKYAPQYGGYCAYGVAQGYLVKIDPEQFRIVDGKLYLNYDAEVQRRWLADPAGYIRVADGRFAALVAK